MKKLLILCVLAGSALWAQEEGPFGATFTVHGGLHFLSFNKEILKGLAFAGIYSDTLPETYKKEKKYGFGNSLTSVGFDAFAYFSDHHKIGIFYAQGFSKAKRRIKNWPVITDTGTIYSQANSIAEISMRTYGFELGYSSWVTESIELGVACGIGKASSVFRRLLLLYLPTWEQINEGTEKPPFFMSEISSNFFLIRLVLSVKYKFVKWLIVGLQTGGWFGRTKFGNWYIHGMQNIPDSPNVSFNGFFFNLSLTLDNRSLR